MKIELEGTLLKMIPENDREKTELNTMWQKIIGCVKEGKKHVSLYLTPIRKDGERKAIYIPKRLEEETMAMVERYFKIKDTLEEISDINLKRLLDKK